MKLESIRLLVTNKNYFSPAWVFASINIMMGTWVLYLPHVKMKFSLNDQEIGVALFCLALGLLLSIPFIPTLNKKIGMGRSTQLGVFLFALSFNLPLLAPNYALLCGSLLLTGWCTGFTDVSMNAVVSTLEKRDAVHIMSSAHGFFSLGGFVGAGIGSVLIGLLTNPALHMLLISVFILLTNGYFSKYYMDLVEEKLPELKHENKFQYTRPLLGLSLVAFIVMYNEGAVEHWSNLFFYDIIRVSESQAGVGFIAFSLCMTLGRFLGDAISKKLGGLKVILAGTSIAFVGYLFVLSAHFYGSIFGFGIVGLGLSVVIPEIFRLAGKTKGVPASVGISFVTGIGYAGFLIGPVLLGYFSSWGSLILSFVFLAFSLSIAFFVTWIALKKKY